MADVLQDEEDGIIVGSGDGLFDGSKPNLPSMEDFLAAIDKMTDLSEEDRQQLRESVLFRQKNGWEMPSDASPVTEHVHSISVQMLVLLAWISIVFLVLVVPVINGMNKLKSLKSMKKLLDMTAKFTPEFKELLVKKLESRVEGERIKVICIAIFILWTAMFLLAVVFFGYKLYKSLVDRERRREEKKRQKLQKKKK